MADRQPSGSPEDRRENFRITDEVLLDYRRLPRQEVALRRQAHARDASSAFALVHEMNELRQQTAILRRQAEQESAVIARLIEHLDRKLDRVIGVLMMHELGSRCPQPIAVDIGADGMGFSTTEVFEVGQTLDIRLMMLAAGLGLHTFAQVVRCGESGKQSGFRVGVQFQFLRDYDREVLVQHLLQRQSMLLRQRKQELEGG
ncbi:MAG: PilZ domain-containing protein [Nitrococcus mobilis]|nr:PilZ domain-containing protein [Nitrococcus mobilis]